MFTDSLQANRDFIDSSLKPLSFSSDCLIQKVFIKPHLSIGPFNKQHCNKNDKWWVVLS